VLSSYDFAALFILCVRFYSPLLHTMKEMQSRTLISLCVKSLILILTVFIIINIGYNKHSPTTSTCSIQDNNGSEIVNCILNEMPQQPLSNPYQWKLPTQDQIDEWRNLVHSMLVQLDCTHLNSILNHLSQIYTVNLSVDQQYCIAVPIHLEIGWPSFFVKIAGNSGAPIDALVDVHLSVAHPVTDGAVAQQGIYILQNSHVAKSLLIAGTTRNASLLDSSCQSSNYETDVAHNVHNLFQYAVMEMRKLYIENNNYQKLLHIQLHGMASTSCSTVSAFIANGVIISDLNQPENNNLKLLYDSIRSQRPDFLVETTHNSTCRLTGGTNVQGRALNMAASESEPAIEKLCVTKATRATGAFIHIEQKQISRDAFTDWAIAIDNAYIQQYPVYSSESGEISNNGTPSHQHYAILANISSLIVTILSYLL
jgi:hypothetical protein